MNKENLLKKLKAVQQLAEGSKWSRLSNNPAKYLYAILYKNLLYKNNSQGKLKKTITFWGKNIQIALPSSTDIYITGGKSHDSEIRLAKFIIKHLQNGNHFIDVGSHCGYFTLLANELVGENGKVFSFEPSSNTYNILKDNTAPYTNIAIFTQAVASKEGNITFYELPNLYSEYNTTDIEQFENEDWFKKINPKKVIIPTTTLDITIGNTITCNPQMIKIDVEGGELEVIKGGEHFLTQNNPYIAMEYLESRRNNQSHKDAEALLKSWNYKAYIINQEGALEEVLDIEQYLVQHQLTSDNIVFKK